MSILTITLACFYICFSADQKSSQGKHKSNKVSPSANIEQVHESQANLKMEDKEKNNSKNSKKGKKKQKTCGCTII